MRRKVKGEERGGKLEESMENAKTKEKNKVGELKGEKKGRECR